MRLLITGDFFVEDTKDVRIDGELKQLFQSCDYRIVNYEGPIVGEYDALPLKSGSRLMQSKSAIKILKDLNVDALTLANNHIMDYGIDGYHNTIRSLEDFVLMGTGLWNDAYKMTLVEQDSLKIGILNFSELQFGMLYDEWTQGSDVVGCPWINHRRVNRLIMESRRQVDYLVTIVHAGVEMLDVPLPEWRDRYRELIDYGCDAVIAHHPHVVQGYENYRGSPIVYSLGNFCFLKKKKIKNLEWYLGSVLLLDISQQGLSMKMYGTQSNNDEIKLMEIELWEQKEKQLCHYLSDGVYMERINEKCMQMMSRYWNLFAMGGLFSPSNMSIKNFMRILLNKYDSIHLINNIRCESHRWCMARALNLILGNE